MKITLRRLLSFAAILLLALAPIASLAQPQRAMKVVTLYYQYDLDSTTAISGSYSPKSPIQTRITTSGSSTTVTALTATTAPFNLIAVNDLIIVNLQGSTVGSSTVTTRRVTAKASADSITVDTAINIPATGRTFEYQKFTAATGATSGWVPLEGSNLWQVAIQLNQLSLGSGAIGFRVEGRFSSDLNVVTAKNLWPGWASADAKCNDGTYSSGYCTYTSANQGPPVLTSADLIGPDAVRLVLILTGTDDGGDTGANAEQITAWLKTFGN